MQKLASQGYKYTGQVIQDGDVVVKHETVRDGVYWIQTDRETILATRHPELDGVWIGIYNPGGTHSLGVDIVRIPQEDVAKKMLLPGEYITSGDMAYVLNKHSRAPGKENETSGDDGKAPLDRIPDSVRGIDKTILDHHVDNTVENAIKAMKNTAYMAYRVLFYLRHQYGSEWTEEHQKQLRRMMQLSNGIHAKEEANLLAIELAEKILGDEDTKG